MKRKSRNQGRWKDQVKNGADPEKVHQDMLAHMAMARSKSSGRGPAFSLEELKEALTIGHGYLSNAAKVLGVPRKRIDYYVYDKWREELHDHMEQIKEARVDFVEDKMLERIEEGSDYLTRYFLSTQAKNRGYGEQAVTIEDNSLKILYVNDWRNPDHEILEGEYEQIPEEASSN